MNLMPGYFPAWLSILVIIIGIGTILFAIKGLCKDFWNYLLQKARNEVQATDLPKLVFGEFKQDTADNAKPWFLEITNLSNREPIPHCKAYLERMETIEGESHVSPNMTLGTRNQWGENRDQGPFELAPRQTKEILICDTIEKNSYTPFRLRWAQGRELKLKMGHYYLHIMVFGPLGEPLRTTIEIKGDKIRLLT